MYYVRTKEYQRKKFEVRCVGRTWRWNVYKRVHNRCFNVLCWFCCLRLAQISMSLCRRRDGKVASVTKTVHGGCVRDAHFEVILEASSSDENSVEDYVIWPFSFDPKTPAGFSLSIWYTSMDHSAARTILDHLKRFLFAM